MCCDCNSSRGAISSLRGSPGDFLASDSQLPHLGVQGGSLQSQACGSAMRAPDNSSGLPQDANNVVSLSVLKQGAGTCGIIADEA